MTFRIARPQLAQAASLLFGGLVAGMFSYGAVNVVYAFRDVTPDVRFDFHTALMSVNGFVMQTMMGLAILSYLLLTILGGSRGRWLAGISTVLAIATFMITRFGNVPINQHIKVWAVSGPPVDYVEILQRWETFHFARTICIVIAFTLIVIRTLQPKGRAQA